MTGIRFRIGLVSLALSCCAPARPLPVPVMPQTYAPRLLAPSLPRDVEILALHNSERRRIGVPAMHWDPALAASARAYAHVLASSGRFAHSPNASRPGQGENLWRGTRGGYRVAEMVGGWLDERSLFRPGLFPNVSANGRWTDVAHYTQIVWRGSTGLGCGLASSDRFDVLVCRYAPAGNVVGAAVPGSPPPIRR